MLPARREARIAIRLLVLCDEDEHPSIRHSGLYGHQRHGCSMHISKSQKNDEELAFISGKQL